MCLSDEGVTAHPGDGVTAVGAPAALTRDLGLAHARQLTTALSSSFGAPRPLLIALSTSYM